MEAKSFVSGMGVGALILAGGMLLGGAAQATKPAPAAKEAALPQDATFKTITASALNIVNSKNDIVASLDASNGGGTLRIFSDGGQPVIGAGTMAGGGRIGVGDRAGQERVRIKEDGSIEVLSDTGGVRARLTSYKINGNTKSDFSGQFAAFDHNGALTDQLPK